MFPAKDPRTLNTIANVCRAADIQNPYSIDAAPAKQSASSIVNNVIIPPHTMPQNNGDEPVRREQTNPPTNIEIIREANAKGKDKASGSGFAYAIAQDIEINTIPDKSAAITPDTEFFSTVMKSGESSGALLPDGRAAVLPGAGYPPIFFRRCINKTASLTYISIEIYENEGGFITLLSDYQSIASSALTSTLLIADLRIRILVPSRLVSITQVSSLMLTILPIMPPMVVISSPT